ncbi:MAG: phosphodiester glycosidase family protein, partial [Thermoguttaceae bacterium]|nr:phosphodiester glycosidase family protein [Thermoguttaceae bacterium]
TLQKIFALRVDTKAEGVAFLSTPPHENWEADARETVRQRTTQFLETNDLAAAVNANFYSPFDSKTIVSPGDSNLCGLAISGGKIVSPAEDSFPSFLVKKDGSVEIRATDASQDFSDVETAVSGSAIFLTGGEVVDTGDKAVHPRTAVGCSADGRYVYFVAIDGRQPGYSVGATLAQTAEALKFFGAAEGLNLDGGGSTTMVVRDGDGSPKVVNRPVNAIVKEPIQLRYNGNSIGVAAKAL